MPFKPPNVLRPASLKSFTQGYAQSLLAGYQSSSASQNSPFHTFVANNPNLVNHFHKSSSSSHSHNVLPYNHTSTGAGTSSTTDAPAGDKALDAYYAAWQKHHRPEEKEWHQFQFAKRIGWKAPTTIPESAVTAEDAALTHASAAQPAHLPAHARQSLPRSQSTSALDDLRKVDLEPVIETEAVRQDAAIIADEIHRVTSASIAATVDPLQLHDESSSVVAVETDASSVASPSSLQSRSTGATSVQDAEAAKEYTQHLTQLAASRLYAQIPAAFESMLNAGIQPTAAAYNALLLAAVHLPKSEHQVVLKVLDVYADMLRRRIVPETSTYTILLNLLATRAADVMVMRTRLDRARARYADTAAPNQFILPSDHTEMQILSEDDSLSLAVRLFDTAATTATAHVFSAQTYHLLITACAAAGRIGDMVRIYADMESQSIQPPASVFSPMIRAFAAAGDLRSAVECYEEYKTFAIANDAGELDMARLDAQVYAAVVHGYAVCDRLPGGLKFLGKIEDMLEGSPTLPAVREAVALDALHPQWLQQDRHADALEHAEQSLSAPTSQGAKARICTDAADKDKAEIATKIFENLPSDHTAVEPATALLAMHLRNGDVAAADAMWQTLKRLPASPELIEAATMYAKSHAQSDSITAVLQQSRHLFSRIRASRQSGAVAVERMDEALEVICQAVLHASAAPAPATSMALLWMMTENGSLIAHLAERLIASLGPDDVNGLSWEDVNLLAQVQAGMIGSHGLQDVAHVSRFAHLVGLIATSGAAVDSRTAKLIEQALAKLDRPDIALEWQNRQYAPPEPMLSPVAFAYPVAPVPATPAYDDLYDPYGASTDFKGSGAIAEELEKTYGRHAAHLNEAMTRFRNMRRTGRHPRYITYAKLIAAAAKENRHALACEILAMAKQDVPLVHGSRVVRHGWVSILDAMVGACLTVGKRDQAAEYHRELTAMGAAPSANTFGLYITTLKESTKTFDEATEAVKIFHQAKTEGVEPSSFLYNALIGKLGKARRIDDCLFYFAEMRGLGIRPTSVTYGTIVNALCRVSDDKFAEELFEEMESMSNYKPRPAPYNSLMQYFLTTKRDRSKVLAYYQRMKANKITPTMHTYKLLIDTHATLEPVDMQAAEAVLNEIRASGAQPEAVHYASLIHAKGCVLHDVAGARQLFDQVMAEGRIPPQASLYQALFEGMVANHEVAATESLLQAMEQQYGVAMTPYIANTLIHGWALAKDISKARSIFDALGREKREPSTYEAMTRAYLAVEQHGHAMGIVGEALRRGYPTAVANKICELVGGGPSSKATVGASA